ncbi:hypothetical protein BDY19DRAFT_985452 [Irpex rosettiformis]|uniref:Uncharacterized protein n=1 Tax=Irpex rosettiformis TaxID=378272 RepID=A0ACB8U352_9APHY|nr:hypothetical protein BDY19DRAFT_985452 [Irpex rosettiformis]
MKRISALVDYASSEEEEEKRHSAPPSKKRVVTIPRRLPALVSTLELPCPKDRPELHQGRIRNTPHVEGQYTAYVYVPLKLVATGSLHSLLHKVLKRARDLVPIIHTIGVSIDPDKRTQLPSDEELHISLTRPIHLRAHQREEFITAIRSIAKAHTPFQASFATFSELTNDERTRTFLTAEIGAGHMELKTLCDATTLVLRKYRQKEFYSEPRFHASIAWALLQGVAHSEHTEPSTTQSSPINRNAADRTPSSPAAEVIGDDPGTRQEEIRQEIKFPTIPHFPPDLASILEAEFGPGLRTRNVGFFDCEYLCVRIGKNVTQLKLSK